MKRACVRRLDTLGPMSSETQPSVAAQSWVEDAKALILSPKARWSGARPFAEQMGRVLLAPGEVASSWLRDRLIVAALARGDAFAALPTRQQEMAMREGVRGYLWLPTSLDDDFEVDGLPKTGDDIAVVSKGASINRHAIMQRQCWAGLRRGRAMGAEFKRSTARQYGWEEQSLYADRLAADLDAFFADEEAVEQFVVDVVPFALQHERFKRAAFVSASLRARLRLMAEQLRRVPPYYPGHLTPIELSEGRRVGDYVQAPRDDGDNYYETRPTRTANSELAIETIEKERRVVLLGDPGSGKSTIARALVLRELQASDRAVAVCVSAPILARALTEASDSWLVVLARCALAVPLDPPAPDECRDLATHLETSRHCFIVLDGIDEVFDPVQRHLIDDVARALGGVPGRVLITSRLMGYHRVPGWRELATLPLGGSFESLLNRWYGDENTEAVDRAIAAYEASTRVRDLVTSPVIAGIVAALAADPTTELGSSEGELYRQAVARLSERRWKNPHQPMRAESEALALLEAFTTSAWAMSGVRGTGLCARWQNVTSYRVLREAGVDVELLRTGELLVGYGATETGAVVDAPWIWLHRSFADYLVGTRLLQTWRSSPEDGRRLLGEVAQYPNAWQAALAFAVNQATPVERDNMLTRLHELLTEGDPGSAIERTLAHINPRADDYMEAWNARQEDVRQEELARSPLLWRRFEEEAFPENVRTARELGPLFREGADRIPKTIDASLAVWVHNRVPLSRGPVIPSSLQASDDLLDRSVDGEFGDWAALNIALLDTERAANRITTRSPYADVALRFADHCYLPTASFHRTGLDDEHALLAVLERFELTDISDPRKVATLLDALSQVDAERSESVLLQVLLLKVRLGLAFREELVAAGGPLITDDAHLARLVAEVTESTIQAAWERFVRVALASRTGGMPIRSVSLTPLPDRAIDVSTEDRLALFEWAADEGPEALDAFGRLLSKADEQFLGKVLDSLGERVRGARQFSWGVALQLAHIGRLHAWRPRLLNLERAEDIVLP